MIEQRGLLRAWSRHESAPRSVCPGCQFESSDGYPESHGPFCPEVEVIPPEPDWPALTGWEVALYASAFLLGFVSLYLHIFWV